MAGVLVHELAHALLHGDLDAPEREKREVEAESVVYVVGRHFDLDMSSSAFYLASWIGEETDMIEERLERISYTSKEMIEAGRDALERLSARRLDFDLSSGIPDSLTILDILEKLSNAIYEA